MLKKSVEKLLLIEVGFSLFIIWRWKVKEREKIHTFSSFLNTLHLQTSMWKQRQGWQVSQRLCFRWHYIMASEFPHLFVCPSHQSQRSILWASHLCPSSLTSQNTHFKGYRQKNIKNLTSHSLETCCLKWGSLLVHCWLEMYLVTSTMENSMQVPQKTNNRATIWSSNSIRRYISWKEWKH